MIDQFTRTIRQLFAFGLVGIATLIVDVFVTQISYLAGAPAFVASAIGFLSGFVVNFPLNRKKVFHHGANDRFSFKVQIWSYAGLSVFNLVTTSATVAALTALGVPISVSKILVTVVFFFWNYLVYRFFIFRKNPRIENPQEFFV